MLALGLEVHGADISADVLHFARKEAEAQNVHPTLFHQRMEECDLPHRYGTIYIANATFQIITDRNVAIAALERFRKHLVPGGDLAPGGQLLLETLVPPAVKEPNGNDAEHPIRWVPVPRRDAEGGIVTTLWSESVDLFEQTLVSRRRCKLYVDGELVRSEVHAHSMRWYFHHELVMMLERAGFVDIRTYGDYTDEPATKDSKRVVYGARRPRPEADSRKEWRRSMIRRGSSRFRPGSRLRPEEPETRA